jgi:tetratricopeptide (TPR) repeat protein
LGKERQGAQDNAGALAAFERSVALDPTNSGPWAELGDIYYGLGQWAKSITALKHAIALNPGDTKRWSYLGQSYYFSGQFALALTAFKHATADPTDAQARELIVAIYWHNLDLRDALLWSQKLAAINAPYGQYYIGYTYSLMPGHTAEAISHFKQALTLAQQTKDARLADAAKKALAQLGQK